MSVSEFEKAGRFSMGSQIETSSSLKEKEMCGIGVRDEVSFCEEILTRARTYFEQSEWSATRGARGGFVLLRMHSSSWWCYTAPRGALVPHAQQP